MEKKEYNLDSLVTYLSEWSDQEITINSLTTVIERLALWCTYTGNDLNELIELRESIEFLKLLRDAFKDVKEL